MKALKPSAPDLAHHHRICRIPVGGLDYRVSTRVLVRPVGLDMVEVGGSTKKLAVCQGAATAKANRGMLASLLLPSASRGT